jgi:type II/III secretion system protein
MTKRFALVLFLALAVCSATYADDAADAQKSLSVKTYQFKHKDADKATAIVKQLMSAEGSISIQPSTNSVVITDRPENLKAITAALAQFDTPAKAFKLSVRLVSASRADANAARTPDDLKDVAPSLAMRYNVLESLGSVTVEGHEGEPGIVDLPSGYRAEFHFGDYDPSSDSIQISDFKLSKLQGDQLTQLLKTTLNLKVGQTVIFGASKPQAQKALVLVFAAKK